MARVARRHSGSSGVSAGVCSFCQKSAHKLISDPGGHVFICDQCIAVCAVILEDDQKETSPASAEPFEGPHPLLSHPQASELMASIADWVKKDSQGRDASGELARMRSIAARMLAGADE